MADAPVIPPNTPVVAVTPDGVPIDPKAAKAAAAEAEKVKEKLEQQSKGIKTGFKKGGLASRKK